MIDRKRHPNWPHRLRSVLREWRGRTVDGDLAWGRDDCIQLGLDVSQALYGFDLLPEMRGSYRTYREGYALMMRCYGSLKAGLEARGVQQIAPHEARLGDLSASVDFLSGAPIIHVHMSRKRRVTFSTEGLVRTDSMPISGVWRL